MRRATDEDDEEEEEDEEEEGVLAVSALLSLEEGRGPPVGARGGTDCTAAAFSAPAFALPPASGAPARVGLSRRDGIAIPRSPGVRAILHASGCHRNLHDSVHGKEGQGEG